MTPARQSHPTKEYIIDAEDFGLLSPKEIRDEWRERIKRVTGKGYRCQAPGCNQPGERVILDAFDDDGTFEGEFEARLCEKHWEEARSVGQ